MQYKVTINKSVEQDIFEDGCQPETYQDLGTVFTFQSSSLEVVKDRIKNNFHLDISQAHEFEGRLEMSQSETEDSAFIYCSDPAKDHHIEMWRQGKIKLYNASYTIYLEKLEVTELNAKVLL